MLKIRFLLFALAAVAAASAADPAGSAPPAPRQARFDGGTFAMPAVSLAALAADSVERQLAETILTGAGIAVDGRGTALAIRHDAAMPAEGYRLATSSDRIELAASDAAGLRYGLDMLVRLRGVDGSVPAGEIMIDATPDNVAELHRLFAALSKLRVNLLVIEFGDNIQYERRTFPRRGDKAFTKAQVRELIAAARAYNIEIVPYFQALSHCVWIFSNPDNLKLLEDPANTTWHTAWCPENPETVAFFTDILEETIELFRPRYIHLSYDEIAYGPYGVCERCRVKAPEQILYDSLMTWHKLLAAGNVRMMLFHDEFLSPNHRYSPADVSGGWKILDRLPRDILFNLWMYGENADDMREMTSYFTGLGFQVLGAGFESLAGLNILAGVMREDSKALGLIDTYWYRAGDWSRHQVAPVAAAATSVAAALGWNPDLDLDRIGWNPAGALTGPWAQPPPPAADSRLWQAALPANAMLGNIVPGIAAMDEYGRGTFRYAFAANQPLWALSGRAGDGLPESAQPAAINRKSDELVFIHACGIPDNRFALSYQFASLETPEIGRYRVCYQDGGEVEIPLRYRNNIADWNSRFGPLVSETLYAGEASDGTLATFSSWRWRNPFPGKTIREIRLESAGYQGVSLLTAAVFGWSRPDAALVIDGFEHDTTEALLARWEITGSMLTGALEILPGQPALSEGTRALLLRSPGSRPDAHSRIILETAIDWRNTPGLLERLFSFDARVEGAPDGFQIGIYIGNADWSNYRVYYTHLQNGDNHVEFAVSGFSAENGSIELADATRLRMNFFLKAMPAPVAVTIDNLRCLASGDTGETLRAPRFR